MKYVAGPLAIAAAFAFTSLLCTPCLADANPFVGTWKTNVAKSKATGRTVTYTKTATGYHFAGGAGEDLDFAMDGKDYSISEGQTVAWHETGTGAWSTTYKVNGKIVSTATHHLSQDGKTLTSEFTDQLDNGSTRTETVVRSRVSGGPGVLGTWKTTRAEAEPNTTTITAPGAGRLRLETPDMKEVIDGPTDGTPFEFQNSYVTGWISTMKLSAPRQLDWVEGPKGKPEFQGSNVVSPDGKTMTVTYWRVGKESEKFVDVMEKQ